MKRITTETKKRKTLLFLLVVMLASALNAQDKGNNYTIPDTTGYSTSPIQRFINEDIYWATKSFRWKNSNFSLVTVSWYSAPSGLFRTNFVTVANQFISVNFLSVYTSGFPMKISKSKFYSSLFYPVTLG